MNGDRLPYNPQLDMAGLGAAAAGALLLGVLSTLYDLIWATWVPRHEAVYGLVHGWRAGRRLWGLAGGAGAGLIAAASFYVLYALVPGLRMGAMFPAWMLLWLLFAALDAHLNGRPIASRATLVRGLLAAVLSGAAFWAISGIWLQHRPEGPNYAWNLVAWMLAYLPGFAALLVERRR